jgi:hypothetical protein
LAERIKLNEKSSENRTQDRLSGEQGYSRAEDTEEARRKQLD